MRWGGTLALGSALLAVACADPPREPMRITPEPPPQHSFECSGPDAILGAVVDDALMVLDANGNTREIHHFELPGDAEGVGIEVAGPYVAAAAWGHADDGGPAIAEVVVLCSDGLVAFSERYTMPFVAEAGEGPIEGDVEVIAHDDGRFGFAFDLRHSHLGVLASAERIATWDEPCGLVALDANDVLLSCDSPNDVYTLQWLDPITMSMTPARARKGPSCEWRDGLVCLDASGTALEIERHDAFERWPLPQTGPGTDRFDPTFPYVTQVVGEQLMLGEWSGLMPRLLVDLEERRARRIELRSPRGMRPMRAARSDLELLDGGVGMVFTNGRFAYAMRSEDGRAWEAIGTPVAGTSDVMIDDAGETIVVTAVDPRLVGRGRWQARRAGDPEVLVGASTQLVRGEVTFVVPRGYDAALGLPGSGDGRRFGYVLDGRVHVVDMERGTSSATAIRVGTRDRFAMSIN